MHRLEYARNNNADVTFKSYFIPKKTLEFSGSVSTSSCLSYILRTTFFLKFKRGLYVVSGVSSDLFTLMGDTSRACSTKKPLFSF